MKLAVPIWAGKVSPVFDTASNLLVLHMEDGEEISRFETFLEDRKPAGRCSRVEELGIDVLICGAISEVYQRAIKASGVKVVAWISGEVEEVLEVYCKGTLFRPRFLMPGCEGDQQE